MKMRKRFQALQKELNSTPAIQLHRCELTFYAPKRVRDQAHTMAAPEQVLSFYEESDGFELDWDMRTAPEADVKGRVRILSLSALLQEWDGVVYFSTTASDDPIRRFHPFDFFVDEACVGLYLQEGFDNSLYYYAFGSDPFRLDVDITGYIDLLISARGFLYWQYALMALKTGTANATSDNFKLFMPQLFPAFNVEKFASAYQRLRLSRR